MVPDMALHPSKPVQFASAHGPLSVKQSRAILARLQKNGESSNIFGKHLALEEEIVDSPLVVGNQVTLLLDGVNTYDAMFSAIKNAKNHINMETFIIENDEIGARFAKLLIRKQRSGVQVNLIYDSYGSINTPKDFFKPLQACGANVLEFTPINLLMLPKGLQLIRRDHRKLLIVDGKISFVGGINISSVYSNGSLGKAKASQSNQKWCDTHLRLEGPVVSEFQHMFMATWREQQGKALAVKDYFPQQQARGMSSSAPSPAHQRRLTVKSMSRCFLPSIVQKPRFC